MHAIAGDVLGNPIGRTLDRTICRTDSQIRSWHLGVGTLLHHMRQLMCQECLPCACPRRILSRSKYHIAADRVRQCVHCLRRFRCLSIRMHPYLTEVVAEARLEESARCQVKWLTGRAEHVMDDGRTSPSPSVPLPRRKMEARCKVSVLPAFSTLTSCDDLITAGALAL